MRLDPDELEQIRAWIKAKDAEERNAQQHDEGRSRLAWPDVRIVLLGIGVAVLVGALAGIGIPLLFRR